MKEKGVKPGREHFTMAMFACVTSGQSALAESVFNQVSGDHQDRTQLIVGGKAYLCSMDVAVLIDRFRVFLSRQYIRSGERADTAMYTVMLRGLLQQNKWKEGYALFK